MKEMKTGEHGILREYPPQYRSIILGIYDDEPSSRANLLKKRLIRLWFPAIRFFLSTDPHVDSRPNLYVALNLGEGDCSVVFPPLPNIYDDCLVCQKIKRSQSFDLIVENFWKSEFWEVGDDDDDDDGKWAGTEIAAKITNKNSPTKIYETWSGMSPEMVLKRMKKHCPCYGELDGHVLRELGKLF